MGDGGAVGGMAALQSSQYRKLYSAWLGLWRKKAGLAAGGLPFNAGGHTLDCDLGGFADAFRALDTDASNNISTGELLQVRHPLIVLHFSWWIGICLQHSAFLLVTEHTCSLHESCTHACK